MTYSGLPTEAILEKVVELMRHLLITAKILKNFGFEQTDLLKRALKQIVAERCQSLLTEAGIKTTPCVDAYGSSAWAQYNI